MSTGPVSGPRPVSNLEDTHMRGRAEAARVAHNHKVAGSSPAPATNLLVL